MQPMKKRPYRGKGAALIVVLAALVLLSILVVGLTVAMRMERSASYYNLERTRAEFFARQGVDSGLALLLDATATNRFWVSGPGYILTSDAGSMANPTNVIALSSGYTNTTNSDVSADLNRRATATGDRVMDPGGTNFTFAWIYVQKDGTFTNAKSTNSVGRFAYWLDDQSSRVDLNTANTRTSPLTGNPSQVSLGALSGLAPFASAIASEAQSRPLTTPLEILGRNAAWTNALFTNRFFLSHYSQDPEINPWGGPRIVLTTRAANATNRTYLSILSSPSTDPGNYANLFGGGLQVIYTNIVSSLARTDWPYAAGGSFASKFGPAGISQMAMDTIEYVRVAESTNTWIDPIVAVATTNNLSLLDGSTPLTGIGTNALIGTVRRPMFCQVGLYCSTNTNAAGNAFLGTLHVQTCLPAGYNAGASSFSGWTLWAEVTSSSSATTNFASGAVSPMTFVSGYSANTLSNIEIPASVAAGIPTNTRVRVALLKSSSAAITNILDIAPLREGTVISCPTATNVTAYAGVNDPRVNKYSANWTALTNLSGDVGPSAHSPNYAAYTGTPASDASTNSVFFRSPNSPVASIGELGYLPTGISSGTFAPWRSLRLLVNSSASTNIPPDWALLDLFTVPVQSRFIPGTDVEAGRVNLNALLRDGMNQTRTNVLNALFTNAAGVTAGNLGSVVSNTIFVRLATGGLNFGQTATYTNLVSVGQLAEIAGLGDQGEGGEQTIRDVASLASVRGDVFAVYSYGQAISVTSSKVNITGEKMLCAIVERYFDSTGAAKFRVISWSQIYP